MNKPQGQGLGGASATGVVVQDQFLTVLGRDEAVRRFEAALDLRPLSPETRVVTLDVTWRTGDQNPLVRNFCSLFPASPG